MIERSQLLGRFAKKCVVIPYATDCGYWSELTEDECIQVRSLRSKYPDLIVTTGRLVPYKGHDVLLEAMQYVQASLVVIGEGPLQNTLRAMAANLGLQSRVHFLGHQPKERLKLFLHAGKVFAFPSTTIAESFGIAQIEAMATGLPIVNTNLATAVPRVARHELEALTVEPGNPTALASALSRLLANPTLAFRLGAAAKARARQEYDQQPFITKIGKVYHDVMRRDAAGT
jgi:rhamnosyl/mannosyltransferase